MMSAGFTSRSSVPPERDFDPRTHRKRVKHYDEPGQAHELTFSCYQRKRLLSDQQLCTLLSHSIDRAVERQGFELVAFVYMPEHVHLIVFPTNSEAEVSRLLFAIKRPFSTRVKQLLTRDASPLLTDLTIRERPARTTFRFWQEGGGYDRNIASIKTLRTAIEYVHNNPVRRTLCDSPGQWKWSSWRYYFDPQRRADSDLPTVHGFSG